MIEINLSVDSSKNKISIDGKKISNVKGIKICKTQSTIPVVSLKLIDEVNITGDALIISDKELCDYSTDELIKEIFSRRKEGYK